MNTFFNKFKFYNTKIINKNDIKKVSDNNLIQSYITAIDNKNKNEIEILYNKNNKSNIEKDIVYEIYKKHELNSERLQFIIENCVTCLNISSSLIKQLMKDNSKELLEILFKNHWKFFYNKFILDLLKYYKSKTPISDSELYPKIKNNKYKISLTGLYLINIIVLIIYLMLVKMEMKQQ